MDVFHVVRHAPRRQHLMTAGVTHGRDDLLT